VISGVIPPFSRFTPEVTLRSFRNFSPCAA
jgi:hypothetical protein